jgi:predicted lipoprotein with Yx(FWY)xxD motif
MRDITATGPGRTQDYRPARRRARWGVAAAGALLGVGALAATALPVSATQHPAAKSHMASLSRVVVDIATVPRYGKVLVDQKGLALYYDTANKPKHWACKGSCLAVWPPLVLPKGQKAPVAGKGVAGLGVVSGPSGRQVTWKGKALYTYVRDSKGKPLGQGLFRIWFLAQPTATKTGTTTKSSSWA